MQPVLPLVAFALASTISGVAFAQVVMPLPPPETAPEPPPVTAPPGPEARPTTEGAPDTWGSGHEEPSTLPEPSQPEPLPPPEAVLTSPTSTGLEGGERAGRESRVRYTLQAIEVRGNRRTRSRVVLRYVPFKAGDVIDVDDPEVELTRYRLLGTGFFRDVQLSLKKGSARGQVILVIEVVERNTIIVNDLWMGLSADADKNGNARPLTAYMGLDVAETNLAGTGITLGGAVGLGQDQLALRVRFLDPAFLGGRWMTSAMLLYNDARDFFGTSDVRTQDPANLKSVPDYAILRYKRFGGNAGFGRDLSVATQLWFHYRLESIDAQLPQAASETRGITPYPILFNALPGRSILSTLRATLQHDTRDHPFLPTHGWFVSVVGDVGMPALGSDYSYEKLDVSASRWWELPWKKHVIRLELFGGAISGFAPFFEQYYVGDFSDFLPDRVLGLNFDRRPSPNFLNTDIAEVRYGDYAAKIGTEYRIPLYRGQRSVFGIDFFGSAGIFGVAHRRDIEHPPTGYSRWQLIPIDLTANLGFRMDTAAGGFAFAFSNVLGFIPVRREASP